MRLDSEFSSSERGSLWSQATQYDSSKAYAFSFEARHRIALRKPKVLIPQRQITRRKIYGARLANKGGTVVDFGSNGPVTSRAGLVYEYTSAQAKLYDIGSFVRDFGEASKVEAVGLSL